MTEDFGKSAEFIDPLRRARGFANAIDANRAVERLGDVAFSVPSERFVGVTYQVFQDPPGDQWLCTCEDFLSRRSACKHIVEVLYRFFPDIAPPQPNLNDLLHTRNWYGSARRFHRSPFPYAEGPAEATRRDNALETMDRRAEELLVDLAGLLNERHPLPCRVGRRTLPAGDRVLVMVVRAVHRKSMRRAHSLIERLKQEDIIAFAPSKASLVTYNTSLETKHFLDEAFVITTAPYRLMESDIIVDSTGLSPFYVSCWRASDAGTQNIQPGTKWFKIHLAVGRLSKAILGFVLTEHRGEGTADIANLKPLIEALLQHGFDLRYVIADNAYLSSANIEFCNSLSASLVGPLKPRNFRNGHPLASVKQVASFRERSPELYDELCRARQAIEGVFSVEKRIDNHIAAIGTKEERVQYRNGMRDALFTSRQNEFLTRMIRHNLYCTVTEEHLRNRRISYARGSIFSHVREIIEQSDAG